MAAPLSGRRREEEQGRGRKVRAREGASSPVVAARGRLTYAVVLLLLLTACMGGRGARARASATRSHTALVRSSINVADARELSGAGDGGGVDDSSAGATAFPPLPSPPPYTASAKLPSFATLARPLSRVAQPRFKRVEGKSQRIMKKGGGGGDAPPPPPPQSAKPKPPGCGSPGCTKNTVWQAELLAQREKMEKEKKAEKDMFDDRMKDLKRSRKEAQEALKDREAAMSQMQQDNQKDDKERKQAKAREEAVEGIEEKGEEQAKAVRKTEANVRQRRGAGLDFGKKLRDAKKKKVEDGEGDDDTNAGVDTTAVEKSEPEVRRDVAFASRPQPQPSQTRHHRTRGAQITPIPRHRIAGPEINLHGPHIASPPV